MREFLAMKLDKLNKELEELSNKREVLYKYGTSFIINKKC